MNDQTPTNQSTNDDGGGIFGSPLIFSSNSAPQGQVSPVTQTTNAPVEEQKIVITNDFQDEEKKPEVKAPEEDLVSMGVTFVNNEVPPKQEVNIFSENSSFKHKEMEAVAPVLTPKPSEPVSKTTPEVPTEELENDFSKTFSTPVSSFSHETSSGLDPIKQEEEKLKRLHRELKDKATAKKTVVKERLEKLRSEKESLGKELEEIKEIESVALKIEEKLKALEAIDTEIDSLEHKAKEELQ